MRAPRCNSQAPNDAPDATDRAFDARLDQAMQVYAAQQANLSAVLSTYTQWAVNDDMSELQLTPADSAHAVRHFRSVPVCTYLPEAQDFVWAWANDSLFTAAQRKAAQALQSLADVTGYGIFRRSHFGATPQELDQLCALALHQLQGLGVFKIKSQSPWICLVLFEPASAAEDQAGTHHEPGGLK